MDTSEALAELGAFCALVGHEFERATKLLVLLGEVLDERSAGKRYFFEKGETEGGALGFDGLFLCASLVDEELGIAELVRFQEEDFVGFGRGTLHHNSNDVQILPDNQRFHSW